MWLTVILIVVLVVALAVWFRFLGNWRKQRDWEEPPGGGRPREDY